MFRRIGNAHPLLVLLLGEFDDQNRRLAGDPEEQNKTDLRVDVVRDRQQKKRDQRPRQRHRHRQQNRNGNHPALVLRNQKQINENQRQGEDQRRLPGGKTLLIRHVGPFKRHSRRQMALRDAFHLLHRLSGAHTGRRRSRDHRGGVHVVVGQILRNKALPDLRERSQRNHLPRRRSNVDPRNIRCLLPVFRLRLHLHLEALPEQIEVVDVPAPEQRLKRRIHIRQRNSQLQHLLPVDVQIKLRQIRPERREHARQFRTPVRFRHQFIQHLLQMLRIGSRPVLQHKGEPPCRPDARNRREAEWNNRRLRNPRQFPLSFPYQRKLILALLLPLFPRFQHDHRKTAVRRLHPGDDVVPRDGEDVPHLLLSAEKLPDLLPHFDCPVQRGPVRKLDADKERPLVLIRNKRGRNLSIDPDQRKREQQIHSPDEHRLPEKRTDQRKIAAGQLVEHPVEHPEQERFPPSLVDRAQKQRAQRRTQRQSVDHRKKHADRNRDAELPVHHARDPAHETDREEHRQQNRGRRDDRRGHLTHRADRRLLRGEPFLLHQTVHVFDDHNRIVHHSPDHQYQCKQGQHIQAKTRYI